MKRLPTIDITGNQIAVGRVPGMVIGRKLGPSFVGYDAPQNFSATNEDRNIALSWDAVDGATAYRILVNSVNDVNTAWEEAFNIGGTTYNFAPELDNGGAADSINVGQKCYFWVVVNDGTTGVSLSDPSSPVSGRAFITVAGGSTAVNVRAPSDSGQTVNTVCFGADPVPDFNTIQVGATQYGKDSGDWYDFDTFDLANDVPVTGSFTFINENVSPFTFWNSEP